VANNCERRERGRRGRGERVEGRGERGEGIGEDRGEENKALSV
jgi:hypothetical protein